MDVLGLSCVTNLAAGLSPTHLSHEEVYEAGKKVEQQLARLLERLLPRLTGRVTTHVATMDGINEDRL